MCVWIHFQTTGQLQIPPTLTPCATLRSLGAARTPELKSALRELEMVSMLLPNLIS